MFERLYFDTELINFLQYISMDSIIAQILLNGSPSKINTIGNFIKRTPGESDSVTFLPINKIEKVDDVWEQCRTRVKIGRFITRFINEYSFKSFSISDVDVERFVNLFKSYFSRDNTKLKIVQGEDVRKYYLEENYFSVQDRRYGTLWNSCMRQKERNKFLKLYSENPEIKMLVLFSSDDKVMARALLWDSVKEFKTDREFKFMDRIYSYYDHDVQYFKDWAKKEGYITKWEQNAKSEWLFDLDGQVTALQLYVILENSILNWYPYLDTFKYYHVSKRRFSNSQAWNFDYCLVQSNGQVEREEDIEEPYYGEEDDNEW